jgi:hypothetical protein
MLLLLFQVRECIYMIECAVFEANRYISQYFGSYSGGSEDQFITAIGNIVSNYYSSLYYMMMGRYITLSCLALSHQAMMLSLSDTLFF